MPVTGACHCGAVRLSALVDASRVFVCHCADCQVMSGSAFRVVVPAERASFKCEGDIREYAKTADSGAVRHQGFCPLCGTPIYSRPDALDAPMLMLRVGGLDQRKELTPMGQLWQRSALPWVDGLTGIEACAEQSLLSR